MKIKANERKGEAVRAKQRNVEEKKNPAQQSLCKCGDFRFPIEN